MVPGSRLRHMIRADGGAGQGEQVAGDFDDDMGDGDFNVDV